MEKVHELSANIPLHRYGVRYLATDLVADDVKIYRARWNHHKLSQLSDGKGRTTSATPHAMLTLQFVPAEDEWTNCFKPVAREVIEEIETAHPVDFDAVAQKYIPLNVRALFAEVLARVPPVKITRLNLRPCLASMLHEAWALALARAPEFNAYMAQVDPLDMDAT